MKGGVRKRFAHAMSYCVPGGKKEEGTKEMRESNVMMCCLTVAETDVGWLRLVGSLKS